MRYNDIVMDYESELKTLVQHDDWSLEALKHVRSQGLKDWWIVAGFVRGLVWDRLHDFTERTPLGDVDVVFFDDSISATQDAKVEQKLQDIAPDYPWEVCNQAHMHIYNKDRPYNSSTDAFSRWAETVSTIGVTLDSGDNVSVAAPYGVCDLFKMVVRPTPHVDADRSVFQKRLIQKRWKSKWPKISLTQP